MIGDTGAGKSSVAKQLSTLLFERKVVSEVKHINLDKINNLTIFASRLSKNSSMMTHASLLDNIEQESQSNSLLILENLSYMLETNLVEFHKMFSMILEKTKLRFLLICRSKDQIF